MIRKGFIIILMLLMSASFAQAQMRGISATPSDFYIDGNSEWPLILDVTISNEGFVDEWIELRVFGATESVRVEPARFALEQGARSRVVVTVDEVDKAIGKIEIIATRNNTEGARTGTGVTIPFAISSGGLTAGDIQRAAAVGVADEASSLISTLVWITLLIVVGLIVARMASRMTRNWDNG
jgi:hypothetical protein